MKTVKVKFVGKWEGIQPQDNLICYWLMKNGYDVQVTEDADYIICDIFGEPLYDYCKYPQIRILECGENYTPDFNVVDYAVCRYPISFGDRSFYLPGCTNPGPKWLGLAEKDRNYPDSFLEEKIYFANLITSHDSEHNYRSRFFEKLNAYKRVESPGTYLNNMPDGKTVDWLNDSKSQFQRQCKFTICFESTSHYGFITEKITDAFFSDTVPIYFGSPNITDIFNEKAFINVSDYESLDAVVERIRQLDQDDEKYLEMLRQPILKDKDLPRRMDEELEKFILHIFEQPYEQAYRRSRVYYPKQHDDFLAQAIAPTAGYRLKQRAKALLKGKT
ncbi:MAG: hypothetical protein IJB59_13145 [Oscillospiraceae bacterium]|nr:hypothetical protein [Oscillospiraceae bacterium]